MHRIPAGKILLVIFLCSLCFHSHCRLFSRKDYKMKGTGTLRLIDKLGADELIASPFRSLRASFLPIEEEPSGRLRPAAYASETNFQTYVFTTRSSVLGFNESANPEGMTISLNNRILNFWTESDKTDVTWKWVDTQRNLNIRFDKNYNPTFKCLILEEGKAFEFDTHFPEAPAMLEVRARRNWHPLELDIYIDDRRITSETVKRRYRAHTIPLRIASGVHRVSIKPRVSTLMNTPKKATPPRILINEVRIRSDNDVILFFAPPDKEAELLEGQIQIRYLSDRTEAGKPHPNLELYRMRSDPAFDVNDQSSNPEGVKKKIALEDLSLEVLMAPPKSQFEFDVHIPPGGALKFGLGIFLSKYLESKQSVKFAIDCLANKGRSRLYEKNFVSDSRPLREQLSFESIDLEEFADKRVKLIFMTEQESQEEKALSFWYNPVITQPSRKNPKIILISLDTLRADHLGCYGYHRDTSPNLDALARDGVFFTHCYAQSSWTLPSHVSLLYSLNSASHQVYYSDQRIDVSMASLADFLRREGYQTSAMTSGGYVSRIFGFDDGFDWYDEPLDKSKDPLGQYEAERLFAHTSEWLKENKDDQFFLFLHTYQPHGPYICPSPWNELFLQPGAEWDKMDLTQFWASRGKDYSFRPEEIANIVSLYDGEIRYTDEMLIKPLIALLKSLGVYDETLIIITSDHGEEFYEHTGWLHGRALYDESIRVPLIVKFPRSQFKGTQVAAKCRLIDVMPTILDVASIKFDKSLLEGQTLISMILGKEKKHRSFISDLAHQNVSVPCPTLIASNSGNLKVIITKSEKEGIKDLEVYDLEKDPEEKTNSILNHGKLIRDFVKMIDAYYREKKKLVRDISLIHMDERQKEKLRALGYIH